MAAAGLDAPAIPSASVTLDDFMTGLIAGLAARGVKAVSIREVEFYEAVEAAFQKLEAISDNAGLRLKFWITRNPVYGDSADVREGITRAVQRDLVSLDNPVYLNMRLRIAEADADSYLAELAGGSALYEQITRVFMEHYQAC